MEMGYSMGKKLLGYVPLKITKHKKLYKVTYCTYKYLITANGSIFRISEK
jgi:hypothetical protein